MTKRDVLVYAELAEEQAKIKYDAFSIYQLSDDQITDYRNQGIYIDILCDKSLLNFGDSTISRDKFPSVDSVTDQLPHVWLVQLVGPIKQEWLEEINVPTYGYICPYTVFARMTWGKAKQLLEKEYIEWIGKYKYSDHFRGSKHETRAGSPHLITPLDNQVIIERFPWNDQIALHNAEDVIYVDKYYQPQLLNHDAKIITQTEAGYQVDLKGSNQVIAITDTGIYRPHEAFAEPSKIVTVIDVAGDSQQLGGDGDGHGTHVAGSAAGDCSPYQQSNKSDGQALSSRLIDVKVFSNYGYWAGGSNEYAFWQLAYNSGARINNNSWGANTNGMYTSSDRNADRIVSDYKEYIVVVANGNSGPHASTIGSPACAKNVISVGGSRTDFIDQIASFSSRGPTLDQRIKPDIVAPGALIQSALTQTIDSYQYKQGTSMAAPQVAGLAALIREYCIKGLYDTTPFDPSAALVKAILINGAVEINGPGSDNLNQGRVPNNSQGWGRANLGRSLGLVDDRKIKLWDSPVTPSTGNIWTQVLSITQPIDHLKITLVYTDLPATPGASVTLINNLNLEVIAPNGEIFRGNNFTNLNPSYSTPGGNFDTRNNVEGVHLVANHSFNGDLPTGDYIIKVIGQNVIDSSLGFAIVAGYQQEEPEILKIGVIGDYRNQLTSLLSSQGYQVDSYPRNNYAQLTSNISSYHLVVINRVDTNSNFDQLLSAAGSNLPIIFLGGYHITHHGFGVLSNRSGDPTQIQQNWKRGPVRVKVVSNHPILSHLPLDSIHEIVNGGDNDYQTYSNLTTGVTIGESQMPGFPGLIGIIDQPRRIIIGSLGVTLYTNINHWTTVGREIFLRSVGWSLGKLQ